MPPASPCGRARRAAASPFRAPSYLSAMRISPTFSWLRRAPATAAQWRMASACSWCRGIPPGSPSQYCRRSTTPGSCARSGSTMSRCRLAHFSAPRLGGGSPLSQVIARATVALAAEMCGGAQQVLDMTVAYAKIRITFGKPIGSYQGVKHQAADMLVAIENAKSLTYYAAWAVDQGLDEAPLAVSMAKAAASDMYRKVAGTGIQLHGGIGMTWEHDLQLYFKRAKASEVAFGDATWHRERVAQLMRL